jgi:hypothetical protein
MSQGGYAIVDVDDEVSFVRSHNPVSYIANHVQPGDMGGQNDELQFKSKCNNRLARTDGVAFLGNNNATGSSRSQAEPDAHSVPFSPFNLTYYQSYFDVDTNTVLKRVGFSLLPRPNFIAETCNGSVDLYGMSGAGLIERNSDPPGPFWTLILVLYTTSTLTASISQYLSDPDQHLATNLPLLSTATSIIYIYGLVVPALLWAATKWLGVADWSIAEALGTYGYAMSIYIPISLLCLIPVGILRWVLVGAGATSSGYFL